MGWSNQEMKMLKIGDSRLDKRVKYTLEQLGESYGSSFPGCFKTRSELVGAYRLFDNKFAKPEKIMEAHYKSTHERAKEFPVVLLINDTSSLDYTSQDVEGLGRLEKDYTKGFFIHPILATTPERLPLGVIDNNIWTRGQERRGKINGSTRANQPIEEKESFRWLQSYQKGCEFAISCPKTQFVFVADRESDILELIAESVDKKNAGVNIDILIRAKHDRVLLQGEERKLKETMRNAPTIAKKSFQIPTRGSQRSRLVEQVIRAKAIRIQGKSVEGRVYPDVTMNAILCIEERPPTGVEPIIWLLLTTLPINNAEDILKIIKYYLCRWEIETFFNVLKNGCNMEKRELKTINRLKVALTLFIIVSWRVMFLMNLSRQNPEIGCDEIFEDAEWMSVCKILIKKVPKQPPRLGGFMQMVGRLGGYLPSKSPPGVKVIWEGLKKMADYALMWDTLHA